MAVITDVYHAPHRPRSTDDNLTILMVVLSVMALIVIGFVFAAR